MPNALCFHPNCQAPLVPMWIYHLQVAAHGQHWLTGATICPNCGHRCLRNVCKGLPVGREKQLAALQRGRERDTWWWTDAQLIRSRAADWKAWVHELSTSAHLSPARKELLTHRINQLTHLLSPPTPPTLRALYTARLILIGTDPTTSIAAAGLAEAAHV